MTLLLAGLVERIAARHRGGQLPTRDDLLPLTAHEAAPPVLAAAARLRDEGHGEAIGWSRKVFIPLTKLCRDVCGYCTFAGRPTTKGAEYLDLDAVLDIARRGADAGCREALFTLGDKPELRWKAARTWLVDHGETSTLGYLATAARAVLTETGLLPHLNPGVMTRTEIEALRPVAVSMGMMLETTSERLSTRGGPHFGSPDKHPRVRLATLEAAGEARVPFTTGLLVGIGESRAERIDTLLAIRAAHLRHGHVQEVIVQNFCAKPGTRMAAVADASEAELLWTIAVARLTLGPHAHIQAPPNLAPGALGRLIEAGIDDWGGVSPVTLDHVNPERRWPMIEDLTRQTAAAGKVLVERTAIGPAFARDAEHWVDPALRRRVYDAVDASGFARDDDGWRTGDRTTPPPKLSAPARIDGELDRLLAAAHAGRGLGETEIARLFEARGGAVAAICTAADELRRDASGDTVTYVVNRNINYTNICAYRCGFCAFSKGRTHEALRGRPYDLDLGEIERRVGEAWERGATEVCLQGGIHPRYTGDTYLEILRTAKRAAPGIHVHAFSPLEIHHGAETAGADLAGWFGRLIEAGLGSLPGTAAEILDDAVRRVICPDKLDTARWLAVIEAAHHAGLRTTATIMFGHVDRPVHWARHLLALRRLQDRTGGFTEFVPLPFVGREAPLYLKGRARPGPTFRETVLMHAVARLVFHPVLARIQTSWVKMGPRGVAACLAAGADDLGGTLMNESITRAAGADHGEEWAPAEIEAFLRGLGREPRQRTTLYGTPPAERTARSFAAGRLAELRFGAGPGRG